MVSEEARTPNVHSRQVGPAPPEGRLLAGLTAENEPGRDRRRALLRHTAPSRPADPPPAPPPPQDEGAKTQVNV
jgi:hypothetical protein